MEEKKSYLQQRVYDLLGLTEEQCSVPLWIDRLTPAKKRKHSYEVNGEKREQWLKDENGNLIADPFPLFQSDENDNIRMFPYTLDGRLIRYELEPGTYTLQGSDAEYLLYYMRVTKDKPTMTDVAQPLLTDYNLSWSGGAYANTEGKGYLKINDAKHIVDEDNLTHTVSLKAENSLTSSLNLSTSSVLAGIDLTVETTRYVFDDNESNISSTTTLSEKYYNTQSNLKEFNAGNYSLCGTINSPEYKYSAFYDYLHLDAVEYMVLAHFLNVLDTKCFI